MSGSEKLLLGETQTARVRLAVVALGSFLHFWLPPAPGELREIAGPVLVLAWVYGLALLGLQPHRRFRPELWAWVSTALDLVFSSVWIAVTGGFESRWWDLYFLGLAACAFRFGLKETVLVGAIYAASYVSLLGALEDVAGNESIVVLRALLIMLMGATCGLLAGETVSQIVGAAKLREQSRVSQEAEAKLGVILRDAPVPLLLLDPAGRVERWNSAAEALLAENGRMPRSFGHIVAWIPEASASALVRVLEGVVPRVEAPAVFHTASGEHHVQIDVSSYRAEGVVKGLACALIDLTARERAEKDRVRARIAAEEAERRRISQELQEEVGQILSTVRVTLSLVARSPNAEQRAKWIAGSRDQVNKLVQRVGGLSRDLRPAVLDDLGLQPALRGFVDRFSARTGIAVDFRPAGLSRRFGQELETAVFRIVQEAIENVARHARTKSVELGVWADEETLSLSVSDEGVGFDPSKQQKAMTSIRDRAELVGGLVEVSSAPGEGTHLSVTFPLPRTEPAA